MIQQLTINFDASLVEAYDCCRDLIAVRVNQQGVYQKVIAADMDMAPSQLTRKLVQYPNDSARFTLDDLEKYFQKTSDREPLHYLNAKYGRGCGLAQALTNDELQAELDRRNGN